MSHPGHRIVRCSNCDKVIVQCRCMDKDKPVEYGICADCLRTAGGSEQMDQVSRAAQVAAASLLDLVSVIEQTFVKPSGEVDDE